MKKLKKLSLLLLACITGSFYIIYACSKEKAINKQDTIPKEVMQSLCPECESTAFWLPENTVVQKATDQFGDTIIEIIAPENYYYLGLSTDSTLIAFAPSGNPNNKVTVTCDCTDGSDEKCKPIGHGGEITCTILAGCNSCERKEKTNVATREEYEILTGGFVDPSAGVSIATTSESDLPYIFESLLMYPKVYKEYETFMLNYYDSLDEIPVPEQSEDVEIAPEGYRFYVLNIYGRALITLLPDDPENKAPFISGVKYTCPCNGETGKCKVKNKFGYRYCEKPETNPCSKACNTMTIEDGKTKTTYSFTYYYH